MDEIGVDDQGNLLVADARLQRGNVLRRRRDARSVLDVVDEFEAEAARRILPELVVGDDALACEKIEPLMPPIMLFNIMLYKHFIYPGIWQMGK